MTKIFQKDFDFSGFKILEAHFSLPPRLKKIGIYVLTHTCAEAEGRTDIGAGVAGGYKGLWVGVSGKFYRAAEC